MESYHKRNFQVRHGEWDSIIISHTFSPGSSSWLLDLLFVDKTILRTRPGFCFCILLLDSFTGFLHWVLLLDSFSCCKVLIHRPCYRDRITTKVQLGRFSLIVENISTRFITELQTLLYSFVTECNKWRRSGWIISNFTKGETFLISYNN